jgi:hypothetical protein
LSRVAVGTVQGPARADRKALDRWRTQRWAGVRPATWSIIGGQIALIDRAPPEWIDLLPCLAVVARRDKDTRLYQIRNIPRLTAELLE